MTAIKRAFKALLLAEMIMLIVGAVPTGTLWLILIFTGAASSWLALIVPGLLALGAPLVAFGEGGGSVTANGHYLGGGIYGHLRRADEQEAAEMAKLLEEHRP